MARREFPRAVKVAVVKRATRDSVVYCESCGRMAKRWRIDHKRADGLLGEPTLENAWLLAECCYPEKDAADTRAIAQAKRREAKHLGVRSATPLRSGNTLQRGPRDPKRLDASKRCAGLSALARRMGLVGEDA